MLTGKAVVECDIYSNKIDIASASNKIKSSLSLLPYSYHDLYISAPSIKDLGLKDIESGSQLLGYLKLNKNEKDNFLQKFRVNGCRGPASLCIPIACNISTIANAKLPDSRDKLPDINQDNDDDDDAVLSFEEKQRDCIISYIIIYHKMIIILLVDKSNNNKSMGY